jgi:hypothetical protein
MSLLSEPGRTLSFSNWQKFLIRKLYNEILSHNTFRRMLISLRDEKPRLAVQLYRSRFADFLDDVEISYKEENLADFLTTEGVLLRQVASELKYNITSPLTDALVRLQVIPFHFPNMPPSPVRETRGDILVILTEALKCSDTLNQLTISHFNFQRCMSTVLSTCRFLEKVSMTLSCCAFYVIGCSLVDGQLLDTNIPTL